MSHDWKKKYHKPDTSKQQEIPPLVKDIALLFFFIKFSEHFFPAMMCAYLKDKINNNTAKKIKRSTYK